MSRAFGKLPLLAVLGLAACATASETDDGSATPDQPDFDSYAEARGEAEDIRTNLMTTDNLLLTAPRSDSASMSGFFDAGIGQTNTALVGEINMTADFGAGSIEGNMDNAFLDRNNGEFDPMTGDIAFAGSINFQSGVVDITDSESEWAGNSDLSANGVSSFILDDGTSYNVFVDLYGDFYNIGGNEVGVDGVLAGSVTIGEDNTIYAIQGGEYVVVE